MKLSEWLWLVLPALIVGAVVAFLHFSQGPLQTCLPDSTTRGISETIIVITVVYVLFVLWPRPAAMVVS